jgi:hypothetical protein
MRDVVCGALDVFADIVPRRGRRLGGAAAKRWVAQLEAKVVG